MDIALIGVIAAFVAFRLVGMTTGKEAVTPLNRKKFLIHLGILAILFGYCVLSHILVALGGRRQEQLNGLGVLHWKAEGLLLNDRAAEATAAAAEALALSRDAYGADDARNRPLLNLLSRCLSREQRFVEAEASAQEALVIATKACGKDDPELALEENNLGVLCVEMGRLDRAETYFRSALARTEKGTGPIPPVLPVLLDNLAGLCDRTGRATEADQLRERAKGFRTGSP